MKLEFRQGREVIAGQDWDYVPRIGEAVIVKDSGGYFRVRDVVWTLEDGEQIARVYLRQADDNDWDR